MRASVLIVSIGMSLLGLGGASAQSVSVGQFDLVLPKDVQVASCEDCRGESEPAMFEWRPDWSAARRSAEIERVEENEEYVEGTWAFLERGVFGSFELFSYPIPEKDRATPARELHHNACQEFRASWGYGFSAFEEQTKIGHCATPVGALVYLVCFYGAEAVLCGNGLHFLDMYRMESDPARSEVLKAAFGHWQQSPTPETEWAVLEQVQEPALVDIVSKVLLSAKEVR